MRLVWGQRELNEMQVLLPPPEFQGDMNMENKVILMVEDNPRDEALTLRALKKSNIANDVVVAVTELKPWIFSSVPEGIWSATQRRCRCSSCST